MAYKLDSDGVKQWFRLIQLSQEWKRPYVETWNRTIDYLKGKYFDDMDDEDRICINMVRPHVNVVIPAVYSRNPDVIVTPRRLDQVPEEIIIKRAEIMQSLLRYYLKELDIKTEVKLCILDAVLTGHGWMKTGYETEIETIEEESREKKETLISMLLKSVGVKEQEEEKEAYRPNEKVVSERVWALRASPYDMFAPALSRKTEELPWITERFIYTHDYVMSQDDWDTEGLKPSSNANDMLATLRGAKYKSFEFGKEIGYNVLYEVWDGVNQCTHLLAEDFDRPLITTEGAYSMLDSKYHPYVNLRFNEIVDEFYCDGDINPAQPQLEELNEVRTKLNTHMKRYNRRYIARPGAFNEQAKADIKLGEDGTIAEHEPQYADDPIDSMIWPITDAAVPAEIYAVESRVKDDLFTILGTSDYASQSSGGARTATEAQIIATQSRHKVEERIDLVEGFMEKIIRNLAQISQRYMDKEQVGAIIGADAVFWTQVFSRREIQGEFVYGVAYGSTLPKNREIEREQFFKAYSMVAQDPYFNQVKLRHEFARRNEWLNPETWLNPQIAKMLEQQRLAAAKQGFLLEGTMNAPQTNGPPGAGSRSGSAEKLPTGQPRGLGAARSSGPVTPGGRGGTGPLEY
jgi:hypothetical protein